MNTPDTEKCPDKDCNRTDKTHVELIKELRKPTPDTEMKKWFEANYLDGDEVQEGQMLASSECLDALTSRDTYWKERELEAYESGRRAGRNDIFKMNGVQELNNEDNLK